MLLLMLMERVILCPVDRFVCAMSDAFIAANWSPTMGPILLSPNVTSDLNFSHHAASSWVSVLNSTNDMSDVKPMCEVCYNGWSLRIPAFCRKSMSSVLIGDPPPHVRLVLLDCTSNGCRCGWMVSSRPERVQCFNCSKINMRQVKMHPQKKNMF